MIPLEWTPLPGVPDILFGWSGRLHIATVVRAEASSPEAGRWVWKVRGLYSDRGPGRQGARKSRAAARHACENVWTRWLADAALQPIPAPATGPNPEQIAQLFPNSPESKPRDPR